jgi:hypothetical protein
VSAVKRLLALVILALSATAVAEGPKTGPLIRLSKDGATIEVTALSKEALLSLARIDDPEQWKKRFAVRTHLPGKDRDAQPAMLGTYRVEKDVLRFVPRFPLTPGVRYRAVLDLGGKPIEKVLSLPKKQPRATVTVSVYPSADRLPENLLKFYLHFSAPMRQGEVYRHIKLLDRSGKAIDMPFLELDQELWDPSGTRFTLFFDPGRIKRGLKPREEVGPALEEGKRYTLVIDRNWRDAHGAPMKEGLRKRFTVLAPDDTQPDTKTWKLAAPASGSRAALKVTFPKSMDHALLHRMLWVIDGARKKVPGTIAVSDKETTWQFTPESPWGKGAHHLVADTRIEDLSGNSIGRPFEVDVLRPVERSIKTETVKIPFSVK